MFLVGTKNILMKLTRRVRIVQNTLDCTDYLTRKTYEKCRDETTLSATLVLSNSVISKIWKFMLIIRVILFPKPLMSKVLLEGISLKLSVYYLKLNFWIWRVQITSIYNKHEKFHYENKIFLFSDHPVQVTVPNNLIWETIMHLL